jgi:conjugative transfer region protein (TIGR03750 family)
MHPSHLLKEIPMLTHINHKMAIYKECTLGEVILVSVASFLGLTFIFSLCTKIMLGYLWPGYLIATALFFFVTQGLLSQLQKWKYGKPYGYYQHLLLKKLSKAQLIESPYITRVGRWSVRRFLK